MKEELINLIGFRQIPRDDAFLFYLNEVDDLNKIFKSNFNSWSNFDTWDNMNAQQWIFKRAIDVYLGKKIDIICNCCEYIYLLYGDSKNRLNQKCFCIKTFYMIEKVLDEIVLAKAIRSNDGTYFV